jgi:hypothetical protein
VHSRGERHEYQENADLEEGAGPCGSEEFEKAVPRHGHLEPAAADLCGHIQRPNSILFNRPMGLQRVQASACIIFILSRRWGGGNAQAPVTASRRWFAGRE